ncbi:MAG: hypothetical protein CM1200mP27_08740 [Chloroflexota bacterium]|nr:MAG: hypothetical protein CM1200mP27_08740 [Chloroflexota bacterium]
MHVGVNACTDITGFGLMGHLRSMVRGSDVGAHVRVADVPVLPGTWDLLEKGTVPGGTFRNMSGVKDTVEWAKDLTGAPTATNVRCPDVRRAFDFGSPS